MCLETTCGQICYWKFKFPQSNLNSINVIMKILWFTFRCKLHNKIRDTCLFPKGEKLKAFELYFLTCTTLHIPIHQFPRTLFAKIGYLLSLIAFFSLSIWFLKFKKINSHLFIYIEGWALTIYLEIFYIIILHSFDLYSMIANQLLEH